MHSSHPGRRSIVRNVATLALALLAGCRDEPKSAPERVRVDYDQNAAAAMLGAVGGTPTPRWAVEGTWIVSESREARSTPLGTALEVEIDARAGEHVASGFALVLPSTPAVALAPEAELVVEVAEGSDAGARILASGRAKASVARHAWSEISFAAPARDRVFLRARLEGATAPAGSAVAWAAPHVERARAGARNLLVISIDTLRADRVGCYGYARGTTPTIDGLAARGARFEHMISTAPWTLPSYGTLFTGLMPARHRAGIWTEWEQGFGSGEDAQRKNLEHLDPRATTLAERLRDAGYATAAFVSNPFLDAETEVDRGFARWVQYLNRASAGVDLALEWFTRRREGAPWFLFLHLIDPHAPYTPPAPFDERFAGRKAAGLPGYPPSIEELRRTTPGPELKKLLSDFYDGEVAYADAQIGRLLAVLDERGELARTVILVHADHGEEFWDHGSFEHGHALHEEVLRVPCIVVDGAKIAAGTVVPERLSTVDLFPTLIELLDLAPAENIEGKSLVARLRAGAEPVTRSTLSEAMLYGTRERKALVEAGEKLVTDGAEASALYELASDPTASRDLARERKERVQAMRKALLDRHRRESLRARAGGGVQFGDDRKDMIEDLGYTGAGGGDATGETGAAGKGGAAPK